MDSLLLACSIVGISSLLAVAGMVGVRRIYGVATLQSYHEMAGNMLSVVGSMYALLLALIVVDAMTNLQEVRNTSETEANSLADVFRLAEGFPPKDKLSIQTQARIYGRSVVDKEWPAMANAKDCPEAWTEYNKLWKAIEKVEPVTEQQKTFYSQMVSEMASMGDNRRSRLVDSRHGISPLLWFVLIIGASATTILTYFFAVEQVKAQSIMIACVATTIGLNLFLIAEYSHPFAGTLQVEPEALRMDLERFNMTLEGSSGGDDSPTTDSGSK